MNNYSTPQPEQSRMVDQVERMSAVEFIRRRFGANRNPYVSELGSQAQTMIRFGQMAAAIAKSKGQRQIKLYHPNYPDGVNGWDYWVWDDAWYRFTNRYSVDWVYPEPSPAILSWNLGPLHDQRWQTAQQKLTSLVKDETPEQAFERRQRAALEMFLVEKEYAG